MKNTFDHVDTTTNVGPWIVRCRVSGGVTGTRESILKRHDQIWRFTTEEAARDEAQAMTRLQNHRNATAFFQYWADLDAEGGR